MVSADERVAALSEIIEPRRTRDEYFQAITVFIEEPFDERSPAYILLYFIECYRLIPPVDLVVLNNFTVFEIVPGQVYAVGLYE